MPAAFWTRTAAMVSRASWNSGPYPISSAEAKAVRRAPKARAAPGAQGAPPLTAAAAWMARAGSWGRAAAALGPWMGFFSAGAGVLLSALTLFLIGRVLGQARLQRLLGRRAARVQSRIIGKGVVAVAMIRMVPIAPFSIVNVVAGASKLSLRDFMLGTVLGMAPGIAVIRSSAGQTPSASVINWL